MGLSTPLSQPALPRPATPHVMMTCPPQVAQLAGYVAEHSAYHHGETSLASTIIGLAQDCVGSNNVNLLYPSGQFGTRLQVRGEGGSKCIVNIARSPCICCGVALG